MRSTRKDVDFLGEIEGLQINPQEICGKRWTGYALDFHSVSRGRRTEIGSLVEQVKYYHDRSKVQLIARIAAKFVKEKFTVIEYPVLPYLDAIIPIPPSDTNRPFQLVPEIAVKIVTLLKLPVYNNYLIKTKRTRRLQFLPSVKSKQAEIQGTFDVRSQDLQERCVLLFDDVYHSGTTLTEATEVLYKQGRVSRVLVLTLTRTYEDRNDEL